MKFSKEYEWVTLEGKIGVSKYVIEKLGDITL